MILAVTGGKGGVGKSTVAYNLAAQLDGCVVDGDLAMADLPAGHGGCVTAIPESEYRDGLVWSRQREKEVYIVGVCTVYEPKTRSPAGRFR